MHTFKMATLCQIIVPILIYNTNAIKCFVNLLNRRDLLEPIFMFSLNSLSLMRKITKL